MMMMMIMLAGLVDSITTPITSWFHTLLNHHQDSHKTTNLKLKELGLDASQVDCVVCLSEVSVGERYGVLTRCSHGFHVECVEAWLRGHSTCPLCRTPVFGDDIQDALYLKKGYDMMSYCVVSGLQIVSNWLTKSFSHDLQSTLSESCNYL